MFAKKRIAFFIYSQTFSIFNSLKQQFRQTLLHEIRNDKSVAGQVGVQLRLRGHPEESMAAVVRISVFFLHDNLQTFIECGRFILDLLRETEVPIGGWRRPSLFVCQLERQAQFEMIGSDLLEPFIMISDRQFLHAEPSVFVVDVLQNGVYARPDVGQDFAFRDVFLGNCFLVFRVSGVQLRFRTHEQRHGDLEFMLILC